MAQRSFGGEFDAMFREAVKDIRQTVNEVFFEQHEHAPEMGTPMNNTPQMTYDDLKAQHGQQPAMGDREIESIDRDFDPSYEEVKQQYAAQSQDLAREDQEMEIE